MGNLFRLLFIGGLAFGIYQAWRLPRTGQVDADLTGALWLAFAVIMGIGAALAWAPVLVGRAVDPLVDLPEGRSESILQSRGLMGVIARSDARGHRRLARWLCFWEGVRHPRYPAQFIIGLRNARPGSWLEKAFAREVFRFNGVDNCLRAAEVLRRHGLPPTSHPNPSVNQALHALNRPAIPERPAVPVPESEAPPLKRNLRIQLPAASDSASAPRPDAPIPPREDGHV